MPLDSHVTTSLSDFINQPLIPDPPVLHYDLHIDLPTGHPVRQLQLQKFSNHVIE